MRCLLLRVFYSWRDVTRYEIFPYHHFQPFSTVLEGEWQAPSPFKLNDVPSYPTPSQELFPLHPFDFPPSPHPLNSLVLSMTRSLPTTVAPIVKKKEVPILKKGAEGPVRL